MVVDHAAGLHERVADRAPDEAEAARAQILAHGVRDGAGGRDGVAAGAIDGYERLEFTHVAAAALVADGSADVALGIRAAAVARGCDFVPLAEEPYELALPAAALDEPRIAIVLEARGPAGKAPS